MARTVRSKHSSKRQRERTLPTRPRINLALSHEQFTQITQPAGQR